MNAFRLGIITAIHGRPRLTDLFMAYYQNLEVPGVDLRCCAAYTMPDDRDRIEATAYTEDFMYDRWHSIEAPNNPRSDKWNAACQFLRFCLGKHQLDAALILGSDDFASAAYIQHAVGLIQKGADYVCTRNIYYYDTATQRLFYGLYDRVGAGRVLSRRLLDQCDYQPWMPGTNRNADYALGQGAVLGIEPTWMPDLARSRMPLVDVKTPEGNITSYDAAYRMAKHARVLSARPFIRDYFPCLLDYEPVCT